jgi:hypothetical protein
MPAAPHRRHPLLGLDLLRFFSFVAIMIFHFEWLVFYGTDATFKSVSAIWDVLQAYAYALSFSGFTIVLLTSFLQGLSGLAPLRRARFFLFLLAGWFLLCAVVASETPFFFVWDVYPLIFVGLATAALVERVAPRALTWIGVTGWLMTAVPFWKFPALNQLPLFWRQIFVGECTGDLADWPVLPWIGLVWSGYAAGKTVRARMLDAEGRWSLPASFELSPREGAVWIAALIAGACTWGPYFHIRLGEYFSCDVFHQPTHVIWGHLVWVFAVARASLDPRGQAWLTRRRFARWVSGLGLSRHFFVFYATHYALLSLVGLANAEWYLAHPRIGEAAFFGTVLIAEFTSRGVGRLLKRT